MRTVGSWLLTATSRLTERGIESARLDAQLILAYVLDRDRGWLLAHDDTELTTDQLTHADELLTRRLANQPLAYIVKRRDFYGRSFHVSPSVLIPRPETEVLVDLALKYAATIDVASHKILDIGTGSGAIAISLAADLPRSLVMATDISDDALIIANSNNPLCDNRVAFVRADLLSPPLPTTPQDLIVANLPYVAHDAAVSPETSSEPAMALYADDDGYDLIEKLIRQCPDHLKATGYLIVECDPWQQERIIAYAESNQLQLVEAERFHIVFRKS